MLGTGATQHFAFGSDYYIDLDDVSVKAVYTPGVSARERHHCFNDPNLTDHHTVSVANDGAGYLGQFTTSLIDSFGVDGGGGTVNWNFTVNDADIKYLTVGQSLIQIYHVGIDDGYGGTVTQDVTVTINGINYAPAVTGETILLGGFTAGSAPATVASTPVVAEVEDNGVNSPQTIDRMICGSPPANLNNQTLPSMTITGSISPGSAGFFRIFLKAGETRHSGCRQHHRRTRHVPVASTEPDRKFGSNNNNDSSTTTGGAGLATSGRYYASFTASSSAFIIDLESNGSATSGTYQLGQHQRVHSRPSGSSKIAVADLLANDTDADACAEHRQRVGHRCGAGRQRHQCRSRAGVTSFTYTVSDGHSPRPVRRRCRTSVTGAAITGTSAARLLVAPAADTITGGGRGHPDRRRRHRQVRVPASATPPVSTRTGNNGVVSG